MDATCAVCLGEFRATATWPVVKLPCGHVFHGCCVQVRRASLLDGIPCRMAASSLAAPCPYGGGSGAGEEEEQEEESSSIKDQRVTNLVRATGQD